MFFSGRFLNFFLLAKISQKSGTTKLVSDYLISDWDCAMNQDPRSFMPAAEFFLISLRKINISLQNFFTINEYLLDIFCENLR